MYHLVVMRELNIFVFQRPNNRHGRVIENLKHQLQRDLFPTLAYYPITQLGRSDDFMI
jgi:hypothetical protein